MINIDKKIAIVLEKIDELEDSGETLFDCPELFLELVELNKQRQSTS